MNIKIKNKSLLILMVFITMFISIYGDKASAETVTCRVTPAHISGTLTLHLSRFGENYPLNRGDFRVKAPQAFRLNDCSSAITSGSTFSLRGPQQLTQTTDNQGNEAWVLPGGADIPFMAVEPFASSVSEGYFTKEAPDTRLDGNNVIHVYPTYLASENAGLDIVSFSAMKLPNSDNSGSVTYNIGQAIGQMSVNLKSGSSFNASPYFDVLYLDSVTVNYVVSSCGIKSKASIVNFGDLFKIDIIHGTVPAKPFAVSLICGDVKDPQSPVNITFSSTDGFADAAKGIVNTNLIGVGLQLSWQNSNLPPLMLDQVNHSTLSGTGDYSVLAKPVSTLNHNDMEGGKLDTSITMSIEFQ